MRVSRTLAETLAPAACTLASWLLACACGSGRAVPPELADEYDAGTPAAPVDASFGAVPTGPTLGDAGCATGTVQAQKRPAYLLFVQDASGSMSQEHKWEAVVPALTSMFADMTQASDPSIAVGLIVFPGTGGPYPASNDVPVGYVDGPQEAFQAAPPLLPGGKKILVLITDGVPTDSCNGFFGAGGYTDNPCVLLATQEDGKAAPQGPIETFVIGVGPFPSSNPVDFDPLFLGSLASAGGAAPATCNPVENANASDLCYLEVDPTKATSAADLQAQITAALDAIRGQVASCAYTLKSSGLGQVDPTQVNVVIDGQTILQDPVNGWTYDDPSSPTEIVLHGASCNQSTATATANVSIVLGCATQTLL
jgi:hypothetical protein